MSTNLQNSFFRQPTVPRKQMGVLQLNGKNYKVYLGLNIVGRNREAAVNIKNLNVSQQHAIITVVNDDLHFISDFKSSNGTRINHTKLLPYSLEKLTDNCQVWFGDVSAIYRIGTTHDEEVSTFEMSQACTQNFYGANTQQLEDTIEFNQSNSAVNTDPHNGDFPITTLPTQVLNDFADSIDMENVEDDNAEQDNMDAHNMPTQINSISQEKDKNSLSTDVYNYAGNYDMHEAATQIISDTQRSELFAEPNLPKTDTQRSNNQAVFDFHEAETQIIDHLPDETLEEEHSDEATQIISNVPPILITDNTEDHNENDVPTHNNAIEDTVIEDNSFLNSVNVTTDTDIVEETIDEGISNEDENSNESIDFLKMQPMDSLESIAASQVHVVHRRSRNPFDSDEEEDNTLKSSEQSQFVNKHNIKGRQNPIITDDDSDSEEIVSKNKCDDNEITQEVNEHKNISQVRKVSSDAETDIEDDDEILKSVPHVNKNAAISNDDSDNDSDVIPATQDVVTQTQDTTQMTKNKTKGNSQNIISTGTSEDSFKLGLTELMDESSMNSQEKRVSTEDGLKSTTQQFMSEVTNRAHSTQSNISLTETLHKAQEKNDHIFDSPTQKIIPDTDNIEEIDHNMEDDVYLLSTQKIDAVSFDENVGNCSRNEESIYLQPTQQVSTSGQKNKSNFLKPSIKKINSKNMDVSEIYLAPTQKLVEDDDICLAAPTQKLVEQDDVCFAAPTQKLVEQHDVCFAAPTQKLVEEDDRCFAAPTQKLVEEDVYFAATQKISNTYLSEPQDTKTNIDCDDGIYCEATQKLTTDIYGEATEKINFSELRKENNTDVESQLEVHFPSQNVRLSKTSDTRPSNPLVTILDEGKNEKNTPDVLVSQNTEELVIHTVNSPNKIDKTPNLSDEYHLAPTQPIDEQMEFQEEVNKKLEQSIMKTEINVKGKKKFQFKKNDYSSSNKETTKKNINTEKNIGGLKGSRKSYVPTVNISTDFKTTLKRGAEEVTTTSNEDIASTSKVSKRTLKHKSPSDKLLTSDNIDLDIEETPNIGLKAKRKPIKDTKSSIDIKPDRRSKRTTKSSYKSKDASSEETNSEPPEGVQEEKDSDKGVPADKVTVTETRKNRRKQEIVEKRQVDEDIEQITSDNIDSDIEETSNIGLKAKRKPIKDTKSSIDIKPDRRSKRTTKSSYKSKDASSEETNSVPPEGVQEEKDSDKGVPADKVTVTEARKNRRKQEIVEKRQVDEDIEQIVIVSDSESVKSNNIDAVEVVQGKSKTKLTVMEAAVKSNNIDAVEGTSNPKLTISEARKSKRKNKVVENKRVDHNANKNVQVTLVELISKQAEKSRKKKAINEVAINVSSDDESDVFLESDKAKLPKQPEEKKEHTDKNEKTNRRGRKTSNVDDMSKKPSTSKLEDAPKAISRRKTNSNLENTEEPQVHLEIISNTAKTNRGRRTTRKESISSESIVESNIQQTNKKIVESEVKPKRGKSTVTKTSSEISVSNNTVNNEFKEPIQSTKNTTAGRRKRAASNASASSSNESEISVTSPTKSRRTIASISDSMLTSPERSKRKLKPKVVFTMMDSPELESVIRQLGGSVVDSVDKSTVLVTKQVKRSQKLLTAVGQGKPICSPDWLIACKKAHTFLDPWDFLLKDKEAEEKWQFSLAESLNKSSLHKLLENYSFLLVVTTATDVLKGAIESCGGKCLTKVPPKNTLNFAIVSTKENKSKYSRYKKQNSDVMVIEAEAIFDGVLRQEKRFHNHLLE